MGERILRLLYDIRNTKIIFPHKRKYLLTNLTDIYKLYSKKKIFEDSLCDRLEKILDEYKTGMSGEDLRSSLEIVVQDIKNEREKRYE